MMHPTEAELAILAVLWVRGPLTVRAVHDVLGPERGVQYTTVLKLMQIMHDKGLLARDVSARSHIYMPTSSREAMQAELVTDLSDRAFGGQTAELVMRALQADTPAPDELAAIEAMIVEVKAERARKRPRRGCS